MRPKVPTENQAGEDDAVVGLEGLDPRPTPLPPSMRTVTQAGSTKKWPPAKRGGAAQPPTPKRRLSTALRAWDAATQTEASDEEGLVASVRAASEQAGGDPEG